MEALSEEQIERQRGYASKLEALLGGGASARSVEERAKELERELEQLVEEKKKRMASLGLCTEALRLTLHSDFRACPLGERRKLTDMAHRALADMEQLDVMCELHCERVQVLERAVEVLEEGGDGAKEKLLDLRGRLSRKHRDMQLADVELTIDIDGPAPKPLAVPGETGETLPVLPPHSDSMTSAVGDGSPGSTADLAGGLPLPVLGMGIAGQHLTAGPVGEPPRKRARGMRWEDLDEYQQVHVALLRSILRPSPKKDSLVPCTNLALFLKAEKLAQQIFFPSNSPYRMVTFRWQALERAFPHLEGLGEYRRIRTQPTEELARRYGDRKKYDLLPLLVPVAPTGTSDDFPPCRVLLKGLQGKRVPTAEEMSRFIGRWRDFFGGVLGTGDCIVISKRNSAHDFIDHANHVLCQSLSSTHNSSTS
eukprot:CAMPEP_0119138168 /NCGR_PEP_ID=MMETSP1310-20130426/25141_1 /TAXON_ID=464262 /ORGANISM="Genus nov. species nov., Strain RCC2339" /LENGTH=423 /DNA_ID=CAMNT_0007129325 /DNA_START=183 /DNA_END=1454 /DNA_ORIENTATION=+